MSKILEHQPLAPYTSLRVGGDAERLVLTETFNETVHELQNVGSDVWLLGYGSNSLISDKGLPGTTIIWRNGEVQVDDALIVADAGVWWDDIVVSAINNQLWGLELMSEIPSSVGGAVFGNIAAYGQQVSDTLAWVDIYDTNTNKIERLEKSEVDFAYRQSSLQAEPHRKILRAAFQLSRTPLHSLRYDSALVIADELGRDVTNQHELREVIIETRRRAGSLYHPDDSSAERTAGSFFKNPMVSVEQAHELAAYDETGKTVERIINQSKVHGGNAQRASAAHVLFAAGFHRGQTWGNVRLHKQHVLKIETLEGATAQDVYNVSKHIIATVREKLGIDLEAEVKFLGEF